MLYAADLADARGKKSRKKKIMTKIQFVLKAKWKDNVIRSKEGIKASGRK